MNSYHEVFIPFTDVYKLGGGDVFQRLERKIDGEKNLVVLHDHMIGSLDASRGESYGAEHALAFMKSIKASRGESVNGFVIYSPYAGLDVAMVPANGDFSMPDLEKKVREHFQLSENKPPILISNRDRYHIMFHNMGLTIQDPEFLQVNADIVYDGIIRGNDNLASELFKKKNKRKIAKEEAEQIMDRELYHNQFIRINGESHKYEYARVTGNIDYRGSDIIGIQDPVVKLFDHEEYNMGLSIRDHQMDNVLGISPRDMEQYIAMQYCLLNPDVSLGFICGGPGTGKTLLSYASAVDQVLWYSKDKRKLRGLAGNSKEGLFKQVVLLKPTEIMGGSRRDPGALPGNLYEKLKPHLGSYIDAHSLSSLGDIPFEQVLFHPRYENDFGGPRDAALDKDKVLGDSHLPGNRALVDLVHSGFIRGRSIPNTIVIIDEAQNYSPYEMKTIIQRVSETSKVIVVGDPVQFDNARGSCSREINGLTGAIAQFIEKPYSALVHLPKNYRHQMSEDADEWRVFSS